MTDPLNTIEDEIILLLKGGTGYETSTITEVSSGNFHTKFREDLRTYYAHELPAIGVMSFGFSGDDTNQSAIDVSIQVVAMGGTLSSLDATVKTIVSKAVILLKKQNTNRGGLCLQGYAEAIEDISGQIIHGIIEEDNDFRIVVLGEINCVVRVMGE